MRLLLSLLFTFPAILVLVASSGEEEDGPVVKDGPPASRYQYVIRTQHFRFNGNGGGNQHQHVTPQFLYPVYLKITHTLNQNPNQDQDQQENNATAAATNTTKEARDDFIVSLTKEKDASRHSRDRKLRNNSTSKTNKPRSETEVKITKVKLKSRSTPIPLKLYLNTLPVTTSAPERTTLRLPSPDFPQPTIFNVTVTRKRVTPKPKPQLPEPLILIQDVKAPDVVYPPTGDKDTEESDSEGEEDDLSVEEDEKRKAIEESSEEDDPNQGQEEEEDENTSTSLEPKEVVKSTEPTKTLTEAMMKSPAANKTLVAGTQDDAKGKSKKKKKKKKGKKKAQLHFVPAPLGPKADIMIRLDKVHKNVKDIVSNIKGAFSDFVIHRPYVNLEVQGQLEKDVPHHVSYFRILPKTNKNRRRDRVKVRGHGKQPSGHRERPTRVLQLPHLLYMESQPEHEQDEQDFPFKDLPPLKEDHIHFKEEPVWVRTWDKENEKEFPRWWK